MIKQRYLPQKMQRYLLLITLTVISFIYSGSGAAAACSPQMNERGPNMGNYAHDAHR